MEPSCFYGKNKNVDIPSIPEDSELSSRDDDIDETLTQEHNKYVFIYFFKLHLISNI